MAPRPLREILAAAPGNKAEKITGKKASSTKDLDLGGLTPKAGDEKKFVAKHKVEKHEDRVGNTDAVYKGTTKETPYKKQDKETYDTLPPSDFSYNEEVEDVDEKYIGFKKLEHKIEAKGKSEEDAKAIASSIGRKKYGKSKFQHAATTHHKMK